MRRPPRPPLPALPSRPMLRELLATASPPVSLVQRCRIAPPSAAVHQKAQRMQRYFPNLTCVVVTGALPHHSTSLLAAHTRSGEHSGTLPHAPARLLLTPQARA